MIDLKKLQEKIDNLLDSETNERMNNWLFKKRYKSLNSLLGEGSFMSLRKPKISTFFYGQKFERNFTSKETFINGANLISFTTL